ncbi:MAG: radical SAM protein [Proteobacteria bacterium]|nr:radical SAM protein [Pseudomonadota bacterium]
MSGNTLVPLFENNTLLMPLGSEMMLLPDRKPRVFNISKQCVETLTENPYLPGEKIFPVAMFNSPGYVNAYACAYEERNNAGYLPLFSYSAAGWGSGGFKSAVIHVDKERRQDLRLMPLEKVQSGVNKLRKKYPENRLRLHLEHCALVSGCPAAKNFFIGRCEAPLPTSQQCNARCLGCISLQKTPGLSCCQERIAFTPTAREIAEVALEHIGKVEQGVVSFGQGCEGDPLLSGDVIREAIILIRKSTHSGTINMNTNASLPGQVERLFDAGLDSMRVSMNSVREPCYTKYFRPQGYSFGNVVESMDIARAKGRFLAINYLNCPGITDSPQEVAALLDFLTKHPVNLIQWRNLNYDPLRYYEAMTKADDQGEPLGMDRLMATLKKHFPTMKHGYFNPPKERF